MQPGVTINIAGMMVRLNSLDPKHIETLANWYADFIDEGSPPLVTIDVEVRPGTQYIPLEAGPWAIRSTFEDGRLGFESFYESGWVDFATGRGQLVMAPQASVENFLRVVFSYLSIERDAILLHASGVVKGERGFVFFGPSGSGKTTTAQLSTPQKILSDDMVLLKVENERVRVYGVPFRGELPETPRSNLNAPLWGLFRLRKDDKHFTVRLNPPRALAEFISCVPYVMSNPVLIRRVVNVGHEILSRVPAMDLHFRRDPQFWEVIEASMD